ncbi:hypothetical protein BGX38DRAFT_1147120 [Terfezia claveryi]|nr:hypothetical protein BGX38DRAFT_1147120 [Terfezia claveryi]
MQKNSLTDLDVKPIQNALWGLPKVRPPMISTLPPYPGFTPPWKQYHQITMWSGTEMRGFGRVILACFTTAIRRETATSRLTPAAQADVKIAIRAVHALSDFCLIAQYRSHTPETIQYMSNYLQDFHKYWHVFGEFRASKADHRKAKGASKDLAATQAHQATISSYFMVVQFGSLPQYSTEITEALHKPLKEAYKRSNRVDATVQILYTHARDHAFKMLELNLCAWDKEVKFDYDIKALVVSMRKDTEGAVKNEDHPKLTGQQQVRNAPPEPLSVLTTALQIPHLVGRFRDYLRLRSDSGGYRPNVEEVANYQGEYYSRVLVLVQQFQGDGVQIHHVSWTGDRDFRRRGNVRANWIWVRRRPRLWDSGGQLDGRTVARVEGLFKI